jgi:translocator assembly and maintenance protein 41
MNITILKNKLLEGLHRYFPVEELVSCYAYGSAVIPQIGNKGKMTDLIFICKDLKTFHEKNMKINESHYSSIAKFGSIKNLVHINKLKSGVYYNPSVEINSHNEKILIKYGVISYIDFLHHFKNWDNLFLPGRFHKPVLSVFSNEEIEEAIRQNRDGAVK